MAASIIDLVCFNVSGSASTRSDTASVCDKEGGARGRWRREVEEGGEEGGGGRR